MRRREKIQINPDGKHFSKISKHEDANMSLVIGLDAGGTYTDAALLDVERNIVRATAKTLTTHDNLSLGLSEAIGMVLAAFDGKSNDIQLISLSTTFATNAVVEGVSGRVGLL